MNPPMWDLGLSQNQQATSPPTVVAPTPSTKPPAASHSPATPVSSPLAPVPVSSPPSLPHHGEPGSFTTSVNAS